MSKSETEKVTLLNLQRQLQRKYDFAYPVDDIKSFFIGIADYINVVQESFSLRAIVLSAILAKRDKLDKQINDLTKIVVKESLKTYETISKIIKKNKIDNQGVKSEITEYEEFVKGKIHISGYGNYGTYLSDKVSDIIIAIEEAGYKDKVKDYGIYDHNGIRTGWKVSSSEQELEKLLSRRREERETAFWGAWEELWQVYDAIYNKYERWDQVTKKNDFMDKMSYGSYYGKIKEVLDDRGKANNYYPFEIKEYKRHLFRINEVLQAEIYGLIARLPDKNLDNSMDEARIAYDKANHSLVIGSNTVRFNKDDSNQAELCRILFNNQESTKKSWDREEILEGWGYPEDRIYNSNGKLLETNRLKVYQTAEKINNKVMKATQGKIIDLLIYSTKTVSVNKKYRGSVSFENVS